MKTLNGGTTVRLHKRLFRLALDAVLQNHIKHIGSDEQTYIGTPSAMIDAVMGRFEQERKSHRLAYEREWMRKYRRK